MPFVETTTGDRTSGVHPSESASIGRVAFASLIGTTIDWYDFYLYGTAAALIFNRLYFPTFDPLAGTLAAFGTYAVGFVARPIGGVIIGHYGDRVGRKSMLVVTLMVMGLATFGIGLLPTYAQVGAWAAAALVLLRLAQGFGVGGEWGGAVLMAMEHAPAGSRGFYGSWPQMGVPLGLLLSTSIFAVFARLPTEQFLSWGWRIPFLLSIVLVGVGLVIRMQILETPTFLRVKETRTESRRPIVEVLRTHPREVLLAMGARLAENGAFYIYTVFVLVYGTQKVGLDRQTVLTGILLAAGCLLLATPLCGRLSDRLGRRPVYLFGACMRRKTPFVLNAVRRSGRAVKPLVLRSAGQAGSPTAVVEHLGRTTGRRYDTPVVATPTDEGFVIALPYGQNTDWLKNVLSAGCATIRFEGASHDIDHPEVVEIQKVEEHFAPKERRQHRRFAVREALIVTTIRKVSNPSTGAPPAG